jgi:twitching motility protein PilT
VSFLNKLLSKSIEVGASDVHIVPGLPPLFRIHTALQPVQGCPAITPEQSESFVHEMINEDRWARFGELRDVDFSHSVEGAGRFRVNAHYQRDSIAIAFRAISSDVPDIAKLNLPPAVCQLAELPRGMVLVTGQTGSGKSTTLASIIDSINRSTAKHIITIEDPVEYELASDKSVIEQRELGSDVPTFASGLKHALRQDPDIILVGEMRDLETTSAAISAAETGHLVLSTLHTQNAAQTIERIIDIYPPAQQNQIQAMLANTLKAVISQSLIKRTDRPGMVPACEVMLCSPAVRSCIRENRIHEIPNIIETSKTQGMCTFDDSVKSLFLNGMISRERALAIAQNPSVLERVLCA